MSRHGMQQQMVVPVQAQAPAGYTPAPAPPKPDPTLDPIAADEPVPVAGFPPLPDRLDLGFGGGSSNGGNWPSGGGGGGGFGGYSGPSPGMAGGGGPNPTFHQHYGHVAPGAFMQGGGGGGGGGYYKANTPPPPAGGGGYRAARAPGADVYNASAPPAYSGASSADLKALGREPKLNERDSTTAQSPDAPTPVVVSQSSTQDLSLPEDEFTYRQPNNGLKNNRNNLMNRMIRAPLNSIGGVAGVRF